MPVTRMELEHVTAEVLLELERATRKFGSFASTHEGYAIIKEELDELWDEVKRNGTTGDMRKEAIQVAAMGMRFVLDVCGGSSAPDR